MSWTEGGMLKHKHSDVGVAVAMPNGLITPIIRNAETKSLSAISNEMKDLAKRARDRKLKPHEYQGGTTSVSNLGMYGIKDFTAVINPPQSTILAVGTGEERAVVRDGKIEAAHIMSVTMSCDHRSDRRRARRRADQRVQGADRKSGDDAGVRSTHDCAYYLGNDEAVLACLDLAGIYRATSLDRFSPCRVTSAVAESLTEHDRWRWIHTSQRMPGAVFGKEHRIMRFMIRANASLRSRVSGKAYFRH